MLTMFPSRNTFYLLIILSYTVIPECKADQVQGYTPATKCKTVDCPTYTVTYSQKEFEIRSYDDALWMSSSPFAVDSIMGAFTIGTNGLDKYYDGGNEQGLKIVKSISPLLIDYMNPLYVDYYYVPQKYQNGSLPKPTSSDVKPVKLPKYKYAAVRRFSAPYDDVNIAVQIDALKKNLQGTAYQRAAEQKYFSLALYINGTFSDVEFYEALLWFN